MAINFNTEPYNDDYDIADSFHRILFRPGYAVQARELTQLQSILQNQVTQFGDHVFKNGSQVIPGSVNVDDKFHFIKLETVYNGENVFSYIESFRDKIITGATSGVKLRVVDTSLCDCVTTQLDIATLYCKIETTAEDGETKRLVVGEEISALEEDNQIDTNFKLTEDQDGDIVAKIKSLGDSGEAATAYSKESGHESSNVIGMAYGVDVKEGIYYIDGYFVRNPELHLYVGRFTTTPTARVGFKVSEAIVTPEADANLLDNATGTPNFAAPGAHRYQINLELVDKAVGQSDEDNFVELLRLDGGVIQAKVERASYSELEKTLARRTYDESGNYEVNKFKLNVREHLNDGTNFGLYPVEPQTPLVGQTYGDPRKFVVAVEPGKAYIQGYEIESVATQYITLDKAREQLDENDNVVENGHIVRLDDQPFGTPVGNYVIVKDVFERPAIDTFQKVFLVKTLNVTGGAAPSASDIVGVARVRGFELHSGDYSAPDMDDTKFKLSLFDIQMYAGYSFEKNVKSITGTATQDNFTCNLISETVNLLGSVTTSSSSTSVTGVGTNFSQSIVAGDVLFVNDTQIGTVQSVTDNLNLTLTANASSTIAGGRISVGRARIFDSEYETLVFPVGYDFVKTMRGFDGTADTVKSTAITVRQKQTQTADTLGVLDVEVTGSQVLASDSDIRNYTLFDNTTNKPVEIDSGDISFNDASDRTIVSIANLTANRSYTLYYTVRQTGTAGQEKTKSLQEDATDVITGKKQVTGSTVELTRADVLRLIKVECTPGDFAAFSDANKIDITNRFTLDNGQRSTHYTNAKLKLRAGQQPPTGAIKVTYDYFAHTGTGNYFSVDSYNTIPYDDIPDFTILDVASGAKKEVNLSQVIDFRPVLNASNTFYPNLPKIGTDAEGSLAYYMGRQDKLVLDSVGRFNVIQGVPALFPQEPEDPKEGMVIATFYIPPYTKSVTSVKTYQRDNRRYTMRDIGKIDRRVSNLEYYVALNMLEKDTETLSIRDVNTGLDKFKNGFIVDQFTGHGIGDVKNADYRCSIDGQSKELRAMHFTTALEVVEDLDSGLERSSKDYVRTNDLISLPYTQSDWIFNPNASRSIDVNPYKIGAFKGEITLMPEGDNWKDTDRRPDLQVTDNNNYDAIAFMAEQLGVTGTVWNEWQTNWTGSSTSSYTWQTGDPTRRRQIVTGYQTTVTTQTGYNYRSGIQTNLTSTINSQDYGDRVVDISFAPYMRARPVNFVAKNLKASTKFYPFFDSIDVKQYCKPADKMVVTRAAGSPLMDFSTAAISNNILADHRHRTYWGDAQPAFQVGDVVTNSTHTATDITAISSCNGVATDTIQMTVASTAGIKPGHMCWTYNMGRSYYDFGGNFYNNNIPPISAAEKNSGIVDTTKTAKQLDWRLYTVKSISGNVLTVSPVSYVQVDNDTSYSYPNNKYKSDKTSYQSYSVRYDDYVPASGYSGGNRAKLVRLQASAVVTYDGYVSDSDNSGNVTQEIWLTNVRHGFAIGDNLTGQTNLYGGSNVNQCVVNSINDHTDATTNPPMKVIGDPLRADVDGAVVGTFLLPQNNSLAFRTGERSFKLTDNISNSDADFDSEGSVNYYSQGVTLEKERTIVNTRTANFTQDRLYQQIPTRRTTTSTRRLYSYYTGHDPLAQTFTVSSVGGAFVTSVDVFFSEAGNRPITVEIRSTNNGVPSTKIIPFSDVTKTPQEVNTSEDGSVATTFNFQAPIYLQDGETYALVVKTDEPGCQVFISELAKEDLITGNIITSQPLTGSLYLSQNSKEFEINPLLDMKFTLRKAVFDISSAVDCELRANAPAPMTLPQDPFEITPNTYKVRVSAPNHGFIAGDLATIDEVAEGLYGTNSTTDGIPETLLNKTHEVLSEGLEKDSFVILLDYQDGDGNSALEGSITSADFLKGSYGGTNITCTRSLHLDSVYLKTSDLNFQDTNIKYYVNAQNADGDYTDYLPMVANSNYTFSTRKHIKDSANQTLINGVGQSSMKFRAVMTSENANVSPIIDMQKISAFSTTNMINNKTQAEINVAEIDSVVLLQGGDILESDRVTAGSGTISISGSAVTGTTTSFLTEVRSGDVLRLLDDTVIGTVDTVNSDTSITLTASSTTRTGVSFEIVGADTTLHFVNNSDGYGEISTNLDAADNLLDNATIGKYITIANAHSNVNGTYVVRDVITTSDNSVYAGNTNLSKVTVVVDPQFAAGATIDMVTDNDYTITQLDKFVEDFAPVGVTNNANYVTRTLSLATAADSLRIIFDASIVSKTDVKVYYRTWDGEIDLDKVPYKDTGFSVVSLDSEGQFRERTIDLEDLAPFTNVNVKIVMKSTDGAAVPKIKNLRMIAVS